MRLLPSLAAGALAVTSMLASPAAAALDRCTAVAPGSCSYQSAGGRGTLVCLADLCHLYVDGVFRATAGFGVVMTYGTSFGDVVWVYAEGTGVAHIGDN